MEEDHVDVNVRGVSWFFYALVPWALSLGAAGWFAFGAGVHEAEKHAQAERRVAAAVGEPTAPTAPYKITLEQSRFFIERARYDGHSLEVYYRNRTSVRLYNYCFQFKQKSADGTIIAGDEKCFPGNERALLPGERAEIQLDLDADSRTTELVLGFDRGLEGYE